MSPKEQFKLNIPADIKRWAEAQAAENMRSLSAEIIFALKEKMQRTAGASPQKADPAVQIPHGVSAPISSIHQP